MKLAGLEPRSLRFCPSCCLSWCPQLYSCLVSCLGGGQQPSPPKPPYPRPCTSTVGAMHLGTRVLKTGRIWTFFFYTAMQLSGPGRCGGWQTAPARNLHSTSRSLSNVMQQTGWQECFLQSGPRFSNTYTQYIMQWNKISRQARIGASVVRQMRTATMFGVGCSSECRSDQLRLTVPCVLSQARWGALGNAVRVTRISNCRLAGKYYGLRGLCRSKPMLNAYRATHLRRTGSDTSHR